MRTKGWGVGERWQREKGEMQLIKSQGAAVQAARLVSRGAEAFEMSHQAPLSSHPTLASGGPSQHCLKAANGGVSARATSRSPFDGTESI